MNRLLSVIAVLFLASSLRADVLLTSADRSVEASAGADCGSDCVPPLTDSDAEDDSTDAFGAWFSNVNANASAGGSDGAGGANQFTTIAPGLIFGTGSAMGDASASGPFAEAGGAGSSMLTATFTVSGASVQWQLVGEITAACTLAGSGLPCTANRAEVQLTGPAGTVFSKTVVACDFGCQPPDCPCGLNMFSLSGVLSPGTYTLTAEAHGSAAVDFGGQGIGSGTGAFDFTFTYDDGIAPCGPGAGPCDEANGTPGCDDVGCCMLICDQDPFCCDAEWDQICAGAAIGQCVAPSNDLCVNRQDIGVGSTPFSTINAATDGLAHPFCQFDGQTYEDIWYTFVATCTGTLTVSTCDAADYDTDLVVYVGCTICPPGDDALLGCNDDAEDCLGFTSEVVVSVVAGQCYTIRVGGWNPNDEGTGTLTLTCSPGGCPCAFDLTGDCVVNAADLAVLLASWGGPYGPGDLAALLAEWGCSD